MAAGELTVLGAEGVEYPVRIGPGVLEDELPAFFASRSYSSVAIITNETIAPLYGQALANRLADLNSALLAIPDGEAYKTLDTVRSLYDQLLASGADRSTLIIALGGGVVGDIAGFVAASFMRGLPLIQAPTSLLAMVDASLGGKTGVDLPQGKNLVGAFKDPVGVFADTFTLETLPEAEFRSGLAEVVKSALIDDPALFDHLRANGPKPIETVIEDAAAVKIAVVEEDRLEKGIRAYLNLGHTFAHALELVSQYAWRHGEAVSVGLVGAARLSERLGYCDRGLSEQVEGLLVQLGLPVRYTGYTADQLWEAMRHDKKWREGAARFVLLRAVGKPTVTDDIARDDVLVILESLRI